MTEEIRKIEKILLAEKPRRNKKAHPLNEYRSLLVILHCKGYTKHNMHRKLLDVGGLDFTSSQVSYYLDKYPLKEDEINEAMKKIDNVDEIKEEGK